MPYIPSNKMWNKQYYMVYSQHAKGNPIFMHPYNKEGEYEYLWYLLCINWLDNEEGTRLNLVSMSFPLRNQIKHCLMLFKGILCDFFILTLEHISVLNVKTLQNLRKMRYNNNKKVGKSNDEFVISFSIHVRRLWSN